MTYDGFMTQHNESLQRMGQAYVDGLLIHGPGECEGESWDQLTKEGVREALSVCGTLRRADGSLRPCDLRRGFGRWRSCVRVGRSGRSASVTKKSDASSS